MDGGIKSKRREEEKGRRRHEGNKLKKIRSNRLKREGGMDGG